MKFSMKKVTVLLADGFEEIEALIIQCAEHMEYLCRQRI